MRAALSSAVVVCFAMNCFGQSSATNDLPTTAPAHADLRRELLRMAEKDQEIRKQISTWTSDRIDEKVVAEMIEIDRRNTNRLKQIIAEYGWPGKSLVGTDGAHAAWLIVQHATHDLPFMKRSLKLMQGSPPGEVAPADVALLTDRLMLKETGKQIYGSQLAMKNGRLVPEPIQDEQDVDRRRAEVGLMPLPDYLDFANKHLAPNEAGPTAK